MNNLSSELVRTLYARFCSIYGEKFVKEYHDKPFIQIWWEEWEDGLKGINVEDIKTALDYCRLNLEWPPSIAEFRKICERSSGVPSVAESFEKAIRGEMNHPIIKLTYDKVGSWAMKNDKEDILKKKFDNAYVESLNQFRANPESEWILLGQQGSKPSLIETNKNLTQEEIKGFKERMVEYQKQAKLDRENKQKINHPVYEKDLITPTSRKFNELIFNERKKYLLNLDEFEAATLEMNDWYDRICYLREAESIEYLKKVGYREKSSEEIKENKYTKPLRVIK